MPKKTKAAESVETTETPAAVTEPKKRGGKKKTAGKTAAPTTKVCPVCAVVCPIDAATCTECGYVFGVSSGPKVVEEVWVDPTEVKEGRNSRIIAEANYLDTVQARALSIAVDGQLSPAEGRRQPDGSIVLDFGYTRKDAVALLRTGFEAVHPVSGEKQLFHDPERKLWVRIVETTPEAAFLRAIKENIERKDTTDLQEALAQDALRTEMGWSDTRIARFYGYDNQNRVMALKKLLTLDDRSRTLVHEGKLALSAALLTEGLSKDERDAIIDGATAGDRVRGEVVKTLVRELMDKKDAEAGAGEATPITAGTETPTDPVAPAVVGSGTGGSPATLKRSIKEFKKFVGDLNDDEVHHGIDTAVMDTLNALVNWFDGKKGYGDRSILNRLQTLKGTGK